jgi:hypothetical protein
VPLLGRRRYGEAGDADQVGAIEGAEHRLAFEAAGDLGKAVADLLVMARRKGAGVPLQPFEA